MIYNSILDTSFIVFGTKLPVKSPVFFTKNIIQSSQVSFLSSSHCVESGMSCMWRHQKSCSFLVVHPRNWNWSFSESFSTYKVTGNTQIVFPWDEIWLWNTENFDELNQLQFATWYAVINSVLICTFHDGVRGQNAVSTNMADQSENIHFTLKIVRIIGQNNSLCLYLTSEKSAHNCRQTLKIFKSTCSLNCTWFDTVF